MSWRGVGKSLQAVVAHGLLFSFTLLFVLKLHRHIFNPWWNIFSPLWLFHAVAACQRFTLPAQSVPSDRIWTPFHALAATPLLFAFELLLCLNLQSSYTISLKIITLPLLALELAILIDNIRMSRALLPGPEENRSDEAIWQTLPHFWVAISMVFFIAATTLTMLKLCGDVANLGWWDLFPIYGVAEFFAFLNCTTLYNPARYLEPSSTMQAYSDEDHHESIICSFQGIGGHIMIVPLVVFQIMLFMRLEETPSSALLIPIPVLFSPLIMLQVAGLFFASYQFVERFVLVLRGADVSRISSTVHACFTFRHRIHGSRLLGWWSSNRGRHVEQARVYHAGSSGYNTFAPDIVKKISEAVHAHKTTPSVPTRSSHFFVVTKKIRRLQAALRKQTEISKSTQEEYERLKNEKICLICCDELIDVVLLPCKHNILCRSCSEKCKTCPICRAFIQERLHVYP